MADVLVLLMVVVVAADMRCQNCLRSVQQCKMVILHAKTAHIDSFAHKSCLGTPSPPHPRLLLALIWQRLVHPLAFDRKRHKPS